MESTCSCSGPRAHCPRFPAMNMRVGLINTGLAEPRSESGLHQLPCQSGGWKYVGEARVRPAVCLTIASLMVAPAQGIALPVGMKTLVLTSSMTTPPGDQTLSACDAVRK